MKEQIEQIEKHLTEIGEELFKKYGTDSYSIRCAIFDVKQQVSKLPQPTVSDCTRCNTLKMMIDNGLGWEDMKNDITYPRT